jgi:hypothetical protein
MGDPTAPTVTTRIPAAFPPRWALFKGLLTGAVVEVPILAAGVWVLATAGLGDPAAPFMQILRLTALFAGIAAVLTAAGIGRLAAFASIELPPGAERSGGRRRAAFVAARAHAAAGVGLIVIAVIPGGHLIARGWPWLLVPIVGAACGAACGAIIGVVCGGASVVRIGDVMAVALRRPSEALRHLLDPDDLLRLGAAVRRRTTAVLGSMFEPAARRPDDAPAPKAGDAPKDAPPT